MWEFTTWTTDDELGGPIEDPPEREDLEQDDDCPF